MTMLTECLSTLFATVWLLSSVTSHERYQIAMFRDGITAPLATVWSMSSVALLKECSPHSEQFYGCIFACQVAKSKVEEVSFHTFLFDLFSLACLLSFREFFTILTAARLCSCLKSRAIYVKNFSECLLYVLDPEWLRLLEILKRSQSRVFSTGRRPRTMIAVTYST